MIIKEKLHKDLELSLDIIWLVIFLIKIEYIGIIEQFRYLIVPSTYDEDRDCEFLIRVFTEQFVETK